MMIPLIVLAIGALFAGYLELFLAVGPPRRIPRQSPSFILGHQAGRCQRTCRAVRCGELWLRGGVRRSTDLARLADPRWNYFLRALAWLTSCTSATAAWPTARQPLWAGRRLVENKFYVDEIYQACVIEPLRFLGQILFGIDRFIVDGIINMFGWIPQLAGFSLKLTVQRGYLQGYATANAVPALMVILLLIFFCVFFWLGFQINGEKRGQQTTTNKLDGHPAFYFPSCLPCRSSGRWWVRLFRAAEARIGRC